MAMLGPEDFEPLPNAEVPGDIEKAIEEISDGLAGQLENLDDAELM
jgi:hypothetical protein